MSPRLFRDRADAGRQLAAMLSGYADRPDVTVLALPRGGVPVGFEIARTLRVPLEVFVVRKLGVPGHEELAVGALASGGVRYVDHELAARLGISGQQIESITARERAELERRESLYRAGEPPGDLRGRTAIVVDDGIATGASMRAAVAALRQAGPARIVVAVPVAAPDVREEFLRLADDALCVMTPEPLLAVGLWYEDFAQTDDDEVRALLRRAREDQQQPQAP